MGLADTDDVPQFLLIVLAPSSTSAGMAFLAIILGLLSWPSSARHPVAGAATAIVEGRARLNMGHIITREIMPNMASYLAVSLIFAMTSAVYAQIGLVFLGLPLLRLQRGIIPQLAWTKKRFSSVRCRIPGPVAPVSSSSCRSSL